MKQERDGPVSVLFELQGSGSTYDAVANNPQITVVNKKICIFSSWHVSDTGGQGYSVLQTLSQGHRLTDVASQPGTSSITAVARRESGNLFTSS